MYLPLFITLTLVIINIEQKPEYSLILYLLAIFFFLLFIVLLIVFTKPFKKYQIKRIENKYQIIEFSKKIKDINIEDLGGIILGNYYSIVGEDLYKKIRIDKFSDASITDYYFIKLLEVKTINEFKIEQALHNFHKDLSIYNAVVFFIDIFDDDSQKLLLEYIRKTIIYIETHHFYTQIIFAPLVYEKRTKTLYFYNHKYFLRKIFSTATEQIL